MIGFLKGLIVDLTDTQLTIDTGSIGYICNVSNSVIANLKVGQEVKIITHMVVKEDDISLYGFLTSQDKNLFLRLISISGVGAKVALSILSGLSGDRLIEVLISGDIASLSSIKGIGKKTAERIVLELKDKIATDFNISEFSAFNPNASQAPILAASNEAILALTGLGYSKAEATRAVGNVPELEKLSVEGIILKALKG